MPKWPMMRPLVVVQADVVALDVDRRAVEAALVRLDVQLAAVEELAPDAAARLRGRAGRSRPASARGTASRVAPYCASIASFTFVMR